MMELLFSARGRLNRSRFWLTSIGFSLMLSILSGVLLYVFWQIMPGQVDASGAFRVEGVTAIPYILIVLFYGVASVWAGLCLGIKRYHDLDKPGAWLLLLLVPVIGGLIYFIQAGCLRGTVGANRYGSDPLAI